VEYVVEATSFIPMNIGRKEVGGPAFDEPRMIDDTIPYLLADAISI
jgi:hypothetical protein